MELKASYSYVSLSLIDKPTHTKTSYVSTYEGSSPHNEATAQVLFNLPKGFEFDPTYRYVGALPAQLTKAYGTADARLGWHFARNLELSVAGQNLLQPRHAELGSVLTERSAYAQIRGKRSQLGPESLDRASVLRLIALLCTSQREPLRWITALAAVVALIGPPSMQGQHAKPTEYEVKATYLYNFSRFVEWPVQGLQAQSDSFAICVLGENPFGPALNATVAQETIAGKSVVAKQISVPQDAVNCRVLFISSSEAKRLKEILTTLGTASVLTVSDLPKFTQRGGMVQFVLEGNRVRFEVNAATTERAGLTLSSELLKVAVNVRKSVQLGD